MVASSPRQTPAIDLDDLDDPWADAFAAEQQQASSTKTTLKSSVDTPPKPTRHIAPHLAQSHLHLHDSSASSSAAASPLGSPLGSPGPRRRVPMLGVTPPPNGNPRSPSHPLALDELALGTPLSPGGVALDSLSLADTDVSDVSRPALKRVTSEAARELAESQSSAASAASVASSERGSGEMFRREEVEVVVHQVGKNESLPGIALRYGIDLATLRKANKLWPSDPVSLRKQLYVPLDACRPSSSSDTIVRGPKPGQVTITRRRPGSGSGSHSRTPSGTSGTPIGTMPTFDELGAIIPSSSSSARTVVDLNAPVVDLGASPPSPPPTNTFVLDLIRLPASQLRTLPRAKRAESALARASLDSDLSHSASSVRALSVADRAERKAARQNRSRSSSLFAPLPLEAGPTYTAGDTGHDSDAERERASKRVVRLRPPRAPDPTPANPTLANRVAALFAVPPPPPAWSPRASLATPPRVSREGTASPGDGGKGKARSDSRGSLGAEQVEMDARPWLPPGMVGTGVRRVKSRGDKKRD